MHLNILANHRHTLTHLPKGSILTPHPKELERLTGKCQDSYERLTKACEFAHTAHVHIVLKGAYSAIITPEANVSSIRPEIREWQPEVAAMC